MTESAASRRPPDDDRAEHDAFDALRHADRGRLRAIVDTEYRFLWRTLRRLGVPEPEVDDCVQEVFLVLARKLAEIPSGEERGFVLGTALRVASTRRRSLARRRESGEADLGARESLAPSAEELVDRKRARELLDCILLDMELELRTVFVLFELEGLQVIQIASALGIPVGTVGSRLRRARQAFRASVKRYEARSAFRKVPP